MDNLSFDEMKKVLKNLTEDLECPICRNTFQPPVSHCVRGHTVCCECRSKLTNCPVCKEGFLDSKIRVLDNLLQRIPHKCKFDGCQETVKSGDDHEKWCGYQPTSCLLQPCQWKGSSNTLLKHIITDHTIWKILVEAGTFIFSIINTEFNEKKCNVLPILAHGQFYYVLFYKNQDYKGAIVLVQNGKIDYTIELYFKIYNDERSYTASVKVTPESWLRSDENTDLVEDTPLWLRSVKKKIRFSFSFSSVEELLVNDSLHGEYKITKL